jgi:hypothetical protein
MTTPVVQNIMALAVAYSMRPQIAVIRFMDKKVYRDVRKPSRCENVL